MYRELRRKVAVIYISLLRRLKKQIRYNQLTCSRAIVLEFRRAPIEYTYVVTL